MRRARARERLVSPEPDHDADDDPPPPRALLGVGFWLLMGFALACVLAGLAISRLGPRLFPAP